MNSSAAAWRRCRPIAIGLLVLVIGSGALFGVRERSAPSQRRSDSFAASSEQRISASHRLESAASTPTIARTDPTHPSERERPEGWFGRILDDRGRPYPHVRVSIRTAESRVSITTLTNEGGEFHLPPPATSERFELLATTVGECDPSVVLNVVVRAWSSRKDLGDVVFPRPATIRGVVIDQDGLPVPGAVVESTQTELFTAITTDLAGRFEVTFEPRSGDARLHARAEGYFSVVRSAESSPVFAGQTTEGVVIRLERGRRIEGQVVDTLGIPVRDASIKFRSERGRLEPVGSSRVPEELHCVTRTDSNGRFFGLVPKSMERFSIVVTHSECGSLHLQVGAEKALNRIVMTRLPTLRLILRETETRAPIAGLAVRIGFTESQTSRPKWRASEGQPWSRTDESGTVSRLWQDEPLESAIVILEAPGYLRTRLGPILRSECETRTMEVSLARGGTVRGAVLDSGGRPRANAQVAALFESSAHDGDHESQRTILELVRSDEQGRYEFDSLPEGKIEIEVRLPPTAASSVRSVTTVPFRVVPGSDPAELNLVMPPLGRIDGVIQESGAPVRSRYFVECRTADGSRIIVDADRDGHFEIPDLPGTTVELAAKVPWVNARLPGSAQQTVKIEPGQTSRVRLDFDPSRLAFTSSRVAVDGQPLVGGTIRFESSGAHASGYFSLDGNGRATGFMGLPGPYEIEVRDVLSNVLAKRTIELIAGDDNSIDFDLRQEK